MTTASSLRPFFTYFGGKWRAAPRYPAPVHQHVIEPFAGSAGYALRYPDRQVTLYDVDPVICAVWRYLIAVSADEVRSLPDVTTSVDDLDIAQEARWLIGFWLNKGVSAPRKTPSRWMRDGIRPGSFWGPEVRARIAGQVDDIRHWRVVHGSYADAADDRATWFVDPPYQAAGKDYRFGASLIDFSHLGEWCRERRGQVIVCENEGADWLPFEPFADFKAMHGARRTGVTREVTWGTSEEAA